MLKYQKKKKALMSLWLRKLLLRWRFSLALIELAKSSLLCSKSQEDNKEFLIVIGVRHVFQAVAGDSNAIDLLVMRDAEHNRDLRCV